MEVSLIILGALVAVGLLLYIHDRYSKNRTSETDEPAPSNEEPQSGDEEVCCGMHITCEKDSLLSSVSSDIVYYDDEELDRYAGRKEDEYTDDEIEEFRDVLLTLIPSDIAGWGRSIQLRGIVLPRAIREELLMIVSEARAAATHA